MNDDHDLPGSVFRILRESADISLKDAACEFGVTVNVMRDIESGRMRFPDGWAFAHVILGLHRAGCDCGNG